MFWEFHLPSSVEYYMLHSRYCSVGLIKAKTRNVITNTRDTCTTQNMIQKIQKLHLNVRLFKT